MYKKYHFIVTVLAVLAVLVLLSGNFSSTYAEMISGRLVSTFDSQNGEATIFFAGYCKDEPVVIGPSKRAATAQFFASCTKDNMGQMFSEEKAVIKKVTKFSNNGRQIVAEVVMER